MSIGNLERFVYTNINMSTIYYILYIKLSVRPDPMSQLVPGVTNKLWD